MGVDEKPAEIAKQGLAKARAEDYDAVIVDTAGRLQVSTRHHTQPCICLSLIFASIPLSGGAHGVLYALQHLCTCLLLAGLSHSASWLQMYNWRAD